MVLATMNTITGFNLMYFGWLQVTPCISVFMRKTAASNQWLLTCACREAELLQRLHHPCIVTVEEVVSNEKQMVIILEYLRGGQLFDQLQNLAGEHYSEQQAAALFAQVLHSSTAEYVGISSMFLMASILADPLCPVYRMLNVLENTASSLVLRAAF